MNPTSRFTLVGVAALGFIAASFTIAGMQQQPPDQPPFQLPPGWTMEDMMACMEAGAPGEMHEYLAKSAGVWHGTSTLWMAPDVEPMTADGISTVTPIMGGRFVKVEYASEWPGMGPYNGFGLYGYDNVAGTFQSVWIEDHSTGMTIGTGELSSDGTTMSWNLTYSCPLTKKPAALREVERVTGEDTKTLEMYTTCPKSGREFKMMEIEFTRKDAGEKTGASRSGPNR